MRVKRLVLTMVLMMAAGQALAGGDEYDGANDTDLLGPAYFGFVRDVKGAPVPDADVVLRPKNGDPVTIQSNLIGLFRSHIAKGVSPDDVDVTCAKSGYKQTRVFRRTPPGSKDMFIEVDCTLQRL